MAPSQDRPASTEEVVSRIRRAATQRLEQEKQLNVVLKQLHDICGRLGAISYPGQIHGHAIKTVADAVCDLDDIRNGLPSLLGTPPASGNP